MKIFWSDHCRTCGHTAVFHSAIPLLDDTDYVEANWIPCVMAFNLQGGQCGCLKYIPKDNLKYMEMVFEGLLK